MKHLHLVRDGGGTENKGCSSEALNSKWYPLLAPVRSDLNEGLLDQKGWRLAKKKHCQLQHTALQLISKASVKTRPQTVAGTLCADIKGRQNVSRHKARGSTHHPQKWLLFQMTVPSCVLPHRGTRHGPCD